MAKNLIASVLGCLILSLTLSSCGLLNNGEPITISTAPVERQPLVLPNVDQVSMKKVAWVIITEDNWEEVLTELTNTGRPVVFFALSDEGYENIALNFQNARQIIMQQQAIIAAYENYYNISKTDN